LATGGVRACSVRTGEEAEEARRPPFRQWLAVVNKPLVALSEDIEQERARTFVGSIVGDTAIVTIRDLRGGRVCTARRIRNVSYTTVL
jgi:hypothetical protein